jgi:hypothetical protein
VDLAGDKLYSKADATEVNVMLSYMPVDPKNRLRRTVIGFREQR